MSYSLKSFSLFLVYSVSVLAMNPEDLPLYQVTTPTGKIFTALGSDHSLDYSQLTDLTQKTIESCSTLICESQQPNPEEFQALVSQYNQGDWQANETIFPLLQKANLLHIKNPLLALFLLEISRNEDKFCMDRQIEAQFDFCSKNPSQQTLLAFQKSVQAQSQISSQKLQNSSDKISGHDKAICDAFDPCMYYDSLEPFEIQYKKVFCLETAEEIMALMFSQNFPLCEIESCFMPQSADPQSAPILVRALIEERNKQWLKKLPSLVEENEKPLLCVGALHYEGTNGLISLTTQSLQWKWEKLEKEK